MTLKFKMTELTELIHHTMKLCVLENCITFKNMLMGMHSFPLGAVTTRNVAA